MKLDQKEFSPLFAEILKKRFDAVILVSVVLLQIGFTYFDIPGWQCPIFHVTGIPCPGCGLSRAALLLVRGDWRRALDLHLFAPFVYVVGLIFALAAVLPEKYRVIFLRHLETLERKTGISLFILLALVGYWVGRLVVNPGRFIHLIHNL